MSFNGELEHFPLVDVIQLLHMTSKTGVLQLKSPKGECQLVFNKGFFVSANHLNNKPRIGRVLIEMEAISQQQLNHALTEQKNQGDNHKPLIATLIEQGVIDKDTAYRGLEALIEMTIVEVLSWPSGSFSLDVSQVSVSDEYRYFPEQLNHEILLNAQGVLMDSLRIYDEKIRDGSLSELFFNEANCCDTAPDASEPAILEITADLLGLEDLDTVTKKIPDVFIGLKDHDPVDEHRRVVTRTLPEATVEQKEQLVSFLAGISTSSPADSTPPVTAIILLTQNEILSHAVTTVCKHENLFVFTTDEENGLDIVIDQLLARDLHPVLIIDTPHDSDGEQTLPLLRQKFSAFPQISVLLASCSHTWHTIGINALGVGARSIIPRPCSRCHSDSYITELIAFLAGICPFLRKIAPTPRPGLGHHFIAAFNQLKTLSEPPEVAQVLLQFTALQFERAVTLVVAKSELIAEKSIGIVAEKSQGLSAPLMFHIPLKRNSVLQEVVEKGRLYYGQRRDAELDTFLYKEIGAPHNPKIMAIPLICRSKVVAVTYADFGAKSIYPPQVHLIEALALHAGLFLDNALYRKSLEKSV